MQLENALIPPVLLNVKMVIVITPGLILMLVVYSVLLVARRITVGVIRAEKVALIAALTVRPSPDAKRRWLKLAMSIAKPIEVPVIPANAIQDWAVLNLITALAIIIG
jgi:hypothetical protein